MMLSQIYGEFNEPQAPSIRMEEYELQNSLANHKVASDDDYGGMIAEVFKYPVSEQAMDILFEFYTIAWNTGKLPKSMSKATLPMLKDIAQDYLQQN